MTVRIGLTEAQIQALEYADAMERSSTEADRVLAAALSAEAGHLVFKPGNAAVIRGAIDALESVGAMEEGFDPEYSEEWCRHCETLAALADSVRRYERSHAHNRGGLSL